MTKQHRLGFARMLWAAVLATAPGLAAPVQGQLITHTVAGTTETWRIDQPVVTQGSTDLTQVVFHPQDGVIVNAGGCVQTGGSGLTWKRYVDPSGPNSDHLYHGLIQIPGIHPALVRIGSVVANAFTIPSSVTAPQNFLRLGYEDDVYPDNGYSSHDDGTGNQCQGVGPAYVIVTILHNVPSTDWVPVGPAGFQVPSGDVHSGQTNAVAVHPLDARTIYVGGSEGGVWKTTDGGATWIPLTDFQLVRTLSSGGNKATLSIASLAVHPSRPETVYAGTGDPNHATSWLGPALGAFVSNNNGSTWAPMGANLTDPKCSNTMMSQVTVNKLLVYPGSPAMVYAATDGGLFTYADDGTDCWKYLNNGTPVGNAIDMVADLPHGAIYAAFWNLGIYKMDVVSGSHWTKLTVGLPASGTFGRVALAFGGRGTAPLPLVFAGLDSNNTYRLFKTVNGGASWSELPNPPSDGQLDFNNTLAVGNAPNEIYIGQVNLWRATDGGVLGKVNDYLASPPVTANSWSDFSLGHPGGRNPSWLGPDVHADNHQIVFAPAGSFTPSGAQTEIFYVVDDGGISKGVVDSRGVVTISPLTLGLTLGQCGTIGLNPQNQLETVCGLWHNANPFLDSGMAQTTYVGSGDGFQTTIDAGSPITVYHDCNAGLGGTICRSTVSPYPLLLGGAYETIWDVDPSAGKIWSDPFRPGRLFRLQGGQIFRVDNANTASASSLNTAAAWTPIETMTGKAGTTTTLAFGSPALGTQPIYYLGTDKGQIWRGSPEAGWIKLCNCGGGGGLPVNAIAPDLTRDRVYAVFKSAVGPGRIKQVSFNGSTSTLTELDTSFVPDLTVEETLSVAVDPADSTGTTIFVGTDQGIYRGQLTGSTWSWTHSPGMPYLRVSDLEVNQGNLQKDQTPVLRAGTYGRGIWELRRFSTAKSLLARSTAPGAALPMPMKEVPGLLVQAVRLLDDGTPPQLGVELPVTSRKESFSRKTPFHWAPAQGTGVSLEAPREIETPEGTLRFLSWEVSSPGSETRSETRPALSLTVEGATKAVAYYQLEEAK